MIGNVGYGSYGGLQPFGQVPAFGVVAPEMLVPFSGYGDFGAAKTKLRKAVNPITGKSTKFYDIQGRGGFRYWVWKGKKVSGDITIAAWPKSDVPPARERYLRKSEGSPRWHSIMSEIGPKLVGAGAGDVVGKAGSIVGSLLSQILPPASGGEEGGEALEETGGGIMDGPGKYVVVGVGALVVVGVLAAALKG